MGCAKKPPNWMSCSFQELCARGNMVPENAICLKSNHFFLKNSVARAEKAKKSYYFFKKCALQAIIN